MSYTASGVYAAEQKLSQMSRNRLLYLNDDLLSKVMYMHSFVQKTHIYCR